MSFILKEFIKGIVLRGESSDITDNIEGSIFHNSNTKKLKTYIDSSVREIITSSQAQTLTNKTIDYNLNTILNLPGGGGGGSTEEAVNLDLSNIVTTAIPVGVDLVSLNTSVGSDSFYVRTSRSSSGGTGRINLASGQIDAGTGNSGGVSIFSGYNQVVGGSGFTGAIDIGSGNAIGSGFTGETLIYTGKSGTNLSGVITLTTGPIDTSQFNLNNSSNPNRTGGVSIFSGRIRNLTSANRTGDIFVGTGSSDTTAGSGSVTVTSGALAGGSGGNSGQTVLSTGSATAASNASSGNLFSVSGDAAGNGNSGASIHRSGNVVDGTSGQADLHSGPATGTGSTGQVRVFSGNASSSGNTGNTLISSGSSSSGNTGNVTIQTGTTSGTRGTVAITGREVYVTASGMSQAAIIANQFGLDLRKNVKIRPDAPYTNEQNFIFLNIENPQYPEIVIGVNNLSEYYARCGQGNLLNSSGGGMSFSGSRLIGTADGTYTTGQVYVESNTADVGLSTASNLQVNTGNLYIKSANAYIKGTGSAANSGDIVIQTGSAAGTGTRGSIYLDGKIIYAHGGAAILNSTLNSIIGIGDIDLLNSSGTVYHKNISSDTNFQFLNGIPGKRFTVVIKNATASSWQANFPTVKQKAGTIINTVAANTSSIFEFVNSSNEYYCISCINNIV